MDSTLRECRVCGEHLPSSFFSPSEFVKPERQRPICKRCAYSRPGHEATTTEGATVDHVIPRSLGGSDDLSNLRLAHWSCNRAKGNRPIDMGEQLRLVG